jgi:hypothetical protein
MLAPYAYREFTNRNFTNEVFFHKNGTSLQSYLDKYLTDTVEIYFVPFIKRWEYVGLAKRTKEGVKFIIFDKRDNWWLPSR